MTDDKTMGPGEAMALLEPNAVRARDALKLTLMSLLARGVLRFEEAARKGLLGTRRQRVLVQAKRPEGLDAPAAAALAALGPLGDGKAMDEVVKRLRKAFGEDFSGFRDGQLLPALVRKGLIEARSERTLLVFKRTRHHLTPAGERERARLEGLMDEARRVPSFLASDPAQALAVVAGLGAAVLLVEELRPHLDQLGQAMGPAFGDFDLSGLDGLDESLSSLDSSFDSADGGGGGGDGGGDGGGGGGGD